METPQKYYVTKADGVKELFDEAKLRGSLRRAGAEEDDVERIVSQILREVRDGITTKKLYQQVYNILKKIQRTAASRYSLRRAVKELGPSGFPFEKYVGEILKEMGYKVQVDMIVQGWCVDHEIDVSARKDGTHILVECKFHHEDGFKTDLKVALYVYQRFLDIQKRHETIKEPDEKFHEIWLVTNTKLTSKAIQYAECAGLTAIGWNYPHKGNLQDLIHDTKLCPVTVLTTLSSSDKRRIMENGIVLCRDIPERKGMLRSMNLDEKKIARVLEEVALLHSKQVN